MKERAGHLPKEISVMGGLALLLEKSAEVRVAVGNSGGIGEMWEFGRSCGGFELSVVS